jgi:hypothetical protein
LVFKFFYLFFGSSCLDCFGACNLFLDSCGNM